MPHKIALIMMKKSRSEWLSLRNKPEATQVNNQVWNCRFDLLMWSRGVWMGGSRDVDKLKKNESFPVEPTNDPVKLTQS